MAAIGVAFPFAAERFKCGNHAVVADLRLGRQPLSVIVVLGTAGSNVHLGIRPGVCPLVIQPFGQTLKNSVNCMIAFLPHALAASIVQILFWGVVILCMPLGLLLMLVFGFWFVTEVSCQIVYGDLDRVFHIEESIRKLKDAELEAALREDYAAAEDDTEE
mgnify:CR=1 FL=1